MRLQSVRNKDLLKVVSNGAVKKLDNMFELINSGFNEITYIIIEKQNKK